MYHLNVIEGGVIIAAIQGGQCPVGFVSVDHLPFQIGECKNHLYLPEAAQQEAQPDLGDDPSATVAPSVSPFKPRPTIQPPEKIEGGFRLSGLPVGTVVEIHDLIGEEVMADQTIADDGSLDFGFADAGHYVIEVMPPNPYVNATFQIEVNDASATTQSGE